MRKLLVIAISAFGFHCSNNMSEPETIASMGFHLKPNEELEFTAFCKNYSGKYFDLDKEKIAITILSVENEKLEVHFDIRIIGNHQKYRTLKNDTTALIAEDPPFLESDSTYSCNGITKAKFEKRQSGEWELKWENRFYTSCGSIQSPLTRFENDLFFQGKAIGDPSEFSNKLGTDGPLIDLKNSAFVRWNTNWGLGTYGYYPQMEFFGSSYEIKLVKFNGEPVSLFYKNELYQSPY